MNIISTTFCLSLIIIACTPSQKQQIQLPEIGKKLEIELPFSDPSLQKFRYLSDFHCADESAISLCESGYSFSETEPGFFKSIPNPYFGVIITHPPSDCIDSTEVFQLEVQLNRIREKHLMVGQSLRILDIQDTPDSRFIVFTKSESTDSITHQIATAFFNNQIEVQFINNKKPLDDSEFDSISLNIFRSIRITSH